MTNDEFSQLAAKAAGVTIGSNGKPAFTSYEQSMKYAEALTNLHKSGIDRNSTPQEIAAASVGTTINKNGTPNISSISQGQSYGSALKNITSNPQPNVSQNSSGANSSTSSSRNNTNNNANPNTTSSTKSASSTNSTSSSSSLSNADFNRLAAQIVGVPTDANGNPVCNSYEQYMQFGKTLANLHNGGINKNSTPQEIAAASAGIKLDKNGKPIFSNDTQRQNYNRALNVSCQIAEDVSSGAPAKSNGDKININNDSQSTDTTSLSMALTGSHSESFENYLRDLEKTYGTQYVFENVFKGDKSKYDPYKRASQITGIPLRGDAPVECGLDGKKAFEAALNGTRNNGKNASGIQLKYNESYDMDINTNAGDKKLTTTGGVGAYNGRKETYYSQRVLPGNGLQIPGRHVSSKDGTIRDKDGYIVVAADLSIYPKGTILECSLGPCKVYDTGVTGEHLDIYCDWMDGIEYSDMTQEQRNSSVTSLKGWLAGER
ncbi:MAG: hypothetical protein HDT25_04150 [Ruminococcus sp.]|nr:hypothetical protein [Ruminococcus sp.]